MRMRLYCRAAIILPYGILVESSSQAARSALDALKSVDYRYFVAGGTCAAISHGLTTPIDVVKTRIQAEPKKYNKGMRSAAVDIVRADGAQSLLGGLGPTVVGYGVEGAMKFGVYELMKPVFAALVNGGANDGKNGLAFLLASVVAGAVAALLLCPMESTRIKIVTDRSYSGMGLFKAFPKLVREEGLFSSFEGIWAMLSKQVPYTFGKQVSFDIFAAYLYSFFGALQDQYQRQYPFLSDVGVKWAVSVCAAFLASIIACLLSQPGDMILTETYRPQESSIATWGRRSVTTERPSFSEVIRTIQEQPGGLINFFTGTGARIVHVASIITIQLVLYDIVKQALGLPATGSH